MVRPESRHRIHQLFTAAQEKQRTSSQNNASAAEYDVPGVNCRGNQRGALPCAATAAKKPSWQEREVTLISRSEIVGFIFPHGPLGRGSPMVAVWQKTVTGGSFTRYPACRP